MYKYKVNDLLSLICGVVLYSVANAQLIIDDGLVLKRGLYKSFEEFKFNNPSIIVDFEVEENTRGVCDYYGYELKIENDKTTAKEVWGFCDGAAVYIKGIDGVFGKPFFDKFFIIGRYCFFEQYERNYIPMSPGGPTFSKREMILNFNNGKIFSANEANIEVLLNQDPALFEEYSKDKRRSKHYRYYIGVYNQKHNEEVKR